MNMQPSPRTDEEIIPDFSMSIFNVPQHDGDVKLHIHLPEDPSIRRHASLALLHGLAIMVLNAEGILADTVDGLLQDGPINEIDAVNRMALMLEDSE